MEPDAAQGSGPRLKRLVLWRAAPQAGRGWTAAVAVILGVMLMPVIAVLVIATGHGQGTWHHLATTVLPDALRQTLLLLTGVGALSLVIGTGTAWIITMYRFPGRAMADRLLVLPLAMPTYIVAYAYADAMDFTGPIQSSLRAMFGWRTANDYWFPDIRSLPGAIFILTSGFYPYVYLTARASFEQQSTCALEVARTLGCTQFGAFTSVALPLARPALAAGVALALMECLNELGAVQYLGVNTLSVTIYTTWLQRGSLTGAAQVATVLLFVVAALLAVERFARGGGVSHSGAAGAYRAIPFDDLKSWRGGLVLVVCLLPCIFGFLLPGSMLVRNAVSHLAQAVDGGFWRAAGNSILLATISAAFAAALGTILAYARRVAASGFTQAAVRLAGLGYALPGTVLALGTLIPLAALDNTIDAAARQFLSISTGLLLSGSILTLIVAYAVRFLAVALGSIEAGLDRISPNLDAAARTLGETTLSALRRVHLPLLRPALGTAALLVFVDVMKELPTTILLRPFNFETLATHVYGFASLEQLEAASVGALAIVGVGLVPVLLLHRTIAQGRAGR